MRYFDLSQIPDYRKAFDDMWAAQKYQLSQREVVRVGYWRLDYYPKPNTEFATKPFNDLEHVMNGLYFIFNCQQFLGQYLPSMNWWREMTTFMIHELGEVVIGDIPNNGSCDTDAKNATEMIAVREFFKPFPLDSRKACVKMFSEFQKEDSFAYGADKIAFLIGQGYLIAHGCSGDMRGPLDRGELSKLDIESIKLAGTYDPFDGIFLRLIEQTREHFWRPIYLAFVEAIYRAEFAQAPYDGKPPIMLQKYYDPLP